MMPSIDNHYRKPLRISLIGMDQRARDALQLFFHNLCHDDYLLADDSAADISIFDMDALHAQKSRAEHSQKHPQRPAILVSLLECEHDGAAFLKKPIQPQELLSALEKIRRELTAGERIAATAPVDEPKGKLPRPPVLDMAVSTTGYDANEDAAAPEKQEEELAPNYSGEIIPLFPDTHRKEEQSGQPEVVVPEPPQKEKAAFLYNPESYLQGYIQKACQLARQQNRNVSLLGPWRPIIILPETREIWVEQSHAHLYALSVMAIQPEDVTITPLESGEMPPEEGGSILPIELFLWKLAVRTARGRIPVGTDLRAPIHLTHWPNLSRLMPIHHGLRIAALWTSQPVSLMETATILNIPPKYIFSFYSAANALGLIVHEKRSNDDDRPSRQANQQQEHIGLFRKILARLRKRT